MTEAQERNLVRFVIGYSRVFDEMYQEYIAYCDQVNAPVETKAVFGAVVRKQGFRIVMIAERAYVVGAVRKGEMPKEPSLYMNDVPPVPMEEFIAWLNEHAWTVEL